MIILRQKQYTSLGRKINAKIGRFRVNAADSLGRVINRYNKNGNEAANKIMASPGVDNKDLLKKSIREARDKYNTRTISKNTFFDFKARPVPGSFTTTTKELKDSINSNPELNKSSKFKNILNSNEHVIVLDTKNYNLNRKRKSAKADAHAHEVGHIKNTANNKWYIKRSTTSDARSKIKNSNLDTGVGLKESGKRVLDSVAILKDEKDANKNALKFLKDNGATKEELKIAKENYKLGLKNYKNAELSYVLNPIQNKIQIPSRRRKL